MLSTIQNPSSKLGTKVFGTIPLQEHDFDELQSGSSAPQLQSQPSLVPYHSAGHCHEAGGLLLEPDKTQAPDASQPTAVESLHEVIFVNAQAGS